MGLRIFIKLQASIYLSFTFLAFCDKPAHSAELKIEKNLNTNSLENWLGIYEYSEWYLPQGKKNKLLLTYNLYITESDTNISCIFEINGLKQKEQAQCSLQLESQNLNVYFKSHLSESYGGQLSRKNHLFELSQDPMGSLTTRWVEFSPKNETSEEGSFFIKVDPNKQDSE